MVTTSTDTATDVDDTAVKIYPLETPNEDIGYSLALLKPILEATISKLYELGYPGWGSYCEVFYQTISDIMVSANEELE